MSSPYVTAYATGAASGLLSVPARNRGAVSQLVAQYLERRKAKRAAEQLLQLSDRVLKDIGLDRDELMHVARHGR